MAGAGFFMESVVSEQRDDDRISTRRAIDLVLEEHEYQRKLYGAERDSQHTPIEWVTILASWLGKAGIAALNGDTVGYKKRLIQVTAIGLSALEVFLSRKGD
jgi:hypothetical protein